MNKFKLIGIALVAMLAMGCMEEVSPGYIGMVKTRDGLTGETLNSGQYSIWGYDRLVLIETREIKEHLAMKILCSDEMNFKFTLVVRTRLAGRDGEAIKELLDRQGSLIKWDGFTGIMEVKPIYETFVKSTAEAKTRDIVREYETTQINKNMSAITKAINKDIRKALKGTPMELVRAEVVNLDYPDVVEKSMELKKTREIEIETEKANQAIKMEKIKNRKLLAEEEEATKAKEALAIVAFSSVVGKQITPEYLEWRKLQIEEKKVEALEEAYKKIGPGDKWFIPYGLEPEIMANIK